ncbi:MAG: ABC transporter permease [Chloroflexota bacterium]|nr:ABC transporter permease [Chloroflexota bacterium]
MNKLYLVGKNEILSLIRRPSFLFATFGLPLFSALLIALLGYLNRSGDDVLASINEINIGGSFEITIHGSLGYVDEGGIITTIPSSVPEAALSAYESEPEAIQALSSGIISAYFMVPADYIQSGDIKFVRPEGVIDQFTEVSDQFMWLLRLNLLEGDIELEKRFSKPYSLEVTYLEQNTAIDPEDPMAHLLLPYGVTVLYYILILTSSSLLLSSVTKEKENRLMEILMSSTTPKQLLGGKIIGLGIVGLFQTVIWISSGYVLLKISGRTFDLPSSVNLTPEFLLWGVLFFVAGYALYASLMAAIGALVPNMREATHATMVVISPMIVPIMMISVLVRKPNDWVALTLSMIPFTAPVTMMTRHTTTAVPLWQSLTSILLLIITSYIIIRSVAKLFHAQNLLSGQPFNLKQFLNTLRQ